jgi:hypothetical protein
MPTTNARKHVIPSAGEQSVNRLTFFETWGLSINDVVPVANVTERSQIVTAMTAKGRGPAATRPLVVHRADAPGLHRIEYCIDPAGSVWLPTSGTLFFATKALADSFGTANGGLLTVGDEARVGSARYVWSGSAWTIIDTGWVALTLNANWAVYTGGEAPKYRVVNGILHMVGRTNATAAAGGVIGVLPATVRPSSVGHLLVFTGWSDSHGIVQLLVGHASGAVVLVQGAGATRTGISLAQISFPVL